MDQEVREYLSDSCEPSGAAMDCTSKEGRMVRKRAVADPIPAACLPRFLYLFLAHKWGLLVPTSVYRILLFLLYFPATAKLTDCYEDRLRSGNC